MTKYAEFTEEDIQKLREQCDWWGYFPTHVGLDALSKIENLKREKRELWEALDLAYKHPPMTEDGWIKIREIWQKYVDEVARFNKTGEGA